MQIRLWPRFLGFRGHHPYWPFAKKEADDLEKEKVKFHHDNVSSRAVVVAVFKLIELHKELLPHSLYSPVQFLSIPQNDAM